MEQRMFEFLDHDQNGCISREDLKCTMPELSVQAIQLLMKELDDIGSDYTSINSFILENSENKAKHWIDVVNRINVKNDFYRSVERKLKCIRNQCKRSLPEWKKNSIVEHLDHVVNVLQLKEDVKFQNMEYRKHQSLKIQIFKKNILSQLFPKVDDEMETLSELFPDVDRKMVGKLFHECHHDLHACFDALMEISAFGQEELAMAINVPKNESFDKTVNDDTNVAQENVEKQEEKRKPSISIVVPPTNEDTIEMSNAGGSIKLKLGEEAAEEDKGEANLELTVTPSNKSMLDIDVDADLSEDVTREGNCNDSMDGSIPISTDTSTKEMNSTQNDNTPRRRTINSEIVAAFPSLRKETPAVLKEVKNENSAHSVSNSMMSAGKIWECIECSMRNQPNQVFCCLCQASKPPNVAEDSNRTTLENNTTCMTSSTEITVNKDAEFFHTNGKTTCDVECGSTQHFETSEYCIALDAFYHAMDMIDIMNAYQQLLAMHGISHLKHQKLYDALKEAHWSRMTDHQKQLWSILDKKRKSDVYKKYKAQNKRVLICGAGPIGLRTAIELQCLGAEVYIVEKESVFARQHILQLCPWLIYDLTCLGAKVLYPEFCVSSPSTHISTRHLQCILFKVSLLLGVHVYPQTNLTSVVKQIEGESFYAVQTSPTIPELQFTAVVGAGGRHDPILHILGIQRLAYHSTYENAVDIIAYFPNTGCIDELSVGAFSMSLNSKNQAIHDKLSSLDIESIVYSQGETHFFIITAHRANLIQHHILPSSNDSISLQNIHHENLASYTKQILSNFKIHSKAPFTSITLHDGSTQYRAELSSFILQQHTTPKLLLTLVGDALKNPFYHEKCGLSQGFHSALDASWLIALLGHEDDTQLLQQREDLRSQLSFISDFQKYTLCPSTRYKRIL